MRPTLVEIAGVPVRAFGVMVLLGFLAALFYAMRMARRKMRGQDPKAPGLITPDHVFDFALVALFVSIAGARLLYVLLSPGEFRRNPWEVFQVWTGGISVHGAIVAGGLYLWWYCRRHRLRFFEFADLASPAFALGYAIGRIGCFLNGCCYGYACDLPWATRFLIDEKQRIWTPPSHPAQIYATLMNLAIFGVLHLLLVRPHRRGTVFLTYLILYCVYRFLDEIFRRGATATIFAWGLTHAQVFSLAMLPFLLLALWRLHRSREQRQTNV